MNINLSNSSDPFIYTLVPSMSVTNIILLLILTLLSFYGMFYLLKRPDKGNISSGIIAGLSISGSLIFPIMILVGIIPVASSSSLPDSTAYSNQNIAKEIAKDKSFNVFYNKATVVKIHQSEAKEDKIKKILPTISSRALNNNERKIVTNEILSSYQVKLLNNSDLYSINNVNRIDTSYLKKNGTKTVVGNNTYSCAPISTITYNPLGEPLNVKLIGFGCLENNNVVMVNTHK